MKFLALIVVEIAIDIQIGKPFDYTSIQCYHCGLIISPQIEYLSLEELNDVRIDNEMEELTELPKQEKDLW